MNASIPTTSFIRFSHGVTFVSLLFWLFLPLWTPLWSISGPTFPWGVPPLCLFFINPMLDFMLLYTDYCSVVCSIVLSLSYSSIQYKEWDLDGPLLIYLSLSISVTWVLMPPLRIWFIYSILGLELGTWRELNEHLLFLTGILCKIQLKGVEPLSSSQASFVLLAFYLREFSNMPKTESLVWPVWTALIVRLSKLFTILSPSSLSGDPSVRKALVFCTLVSKHLHSVAVWTRRWFQA